jgi:CRP/FNR family cyclic AMP-dependent transcriptional regulator
MKTRFEGPEGKRRLIEAIRSQRLIEHDEALATALVEAGELVEIATGTQFLTQGNADDDAYFIIDGNAGVFVNGRSVATRTSRDSVGEMALIDPSVRRSASVSALSTVTAFKIAEPQFKTITASNARVWQALAQVIAERLRQRNQFHRPPNDLPVLFIGSSVEGLSIAQEIQLGLKHDKIKVRPWSMPGVFGPGGISIDVLTREVDLSDFAAFVFGPDDKVFSREEAYEAPRDNVVFELGLFMGHLDRNRSFIIKDQHADIKIPTDLLGVTPITYVSKPGEDLSAPVSTICTEIRKVIKSVGVR